MKHDTTFAISLLGSSRPRESAAPQKLSEFAKRQGDALEGGGAKRAALAVSSDAATAASGCEG